MLRTKAIILFALLASLFSYAQQTITVGTGTTSSYNNVINGYYNYSKYQYIYTDSEIGGSGTIDKIRFYVNSYYLGYSSGDIDNVVITMGHTTTEYYASSAFISGATDTVWTGSWQSIGAGWYEIDLVNNFSYNGVDNLVVEIRSIDGTWSGNQIPECRYTDLGAGDINYKSVKGYSDTSNPPTGTRSKQRANIQLEFSTYITPMSLTTSVTNESCLAPQSGSIDLTLSGGVTPYMYTWSNGATSQDLSGLAQGTYTVTLSDNDSPITQIIQTFELSKQIAWQATTGITADNNINKLTKTAGSGETNSWATSKNELIGDGGLSFVVSSTAEEFVIGLSTSHHTIGNYHNISYSWEQYFGNMWIIESGQSIGYTSMMVGDKFEVLRNGTTIRYLKNGMELRTQTLPSTTPLYVEASIDGLGASINDIIVDFCLPFTVTSTITNADCSPNGSINISVTDYVAPLTYSWSNSTTTEDLTNINSGTYSLTISDNNQPPTTRTYSYEVSNNTVWQYISGISPTNNPNKLYKTANNQTNNSWASSSNELIGNGTISFVVNNMTDEFIFGFSRTHHTQGSYYAVDYAWEQYGSTNMWLSTSYNNAIGYTSRAIGDVFSISREGDTLRYYKNGIAYNHVDTVSNEIPLYLEVSMNNKFGAVNNIKLDFCETLQTGTADVINEQCTNPNSGQITVYPANGKYPYTYNWSNGQQTQTATGLSAGIYAVTVQDANTPPHTIISQYEVTKQIEWNYSAGISIDQGHNKLTKTAITGTTNSWVSSANRFTGDGEVSFVVSNTSEEFILGYSKSHHTEGSYYAVDYAWEQYAGNMWLVTAAGGAIGYTTMSVGDEFRILRIGNLIKYYKNNILFVHTDTLVGDTMLYVEASIDQQGADIENIKADFCVPVTFTESIIEVTDSSLATISISLDGGVPPYVIEWNGDTLLTVDETMYYLDSLNLFDSLLLDSTMLHLALDSLRDTVLYNLPSGIYTVNVRSADGTSQFRKFILSEPITWMGENNVNITNEEVQSTSQTDGWGTSLLSTANIIKTGGKKSVEIDIVQEAVTQAIGLSEVTSLQATSHLDMKYAFLLDNGAVKIWSDSDTIVTPDTLKLGDHLSIEVEGTTARFKRNDVELYSKTLPLSEYRLDMSLYTANSRTGRPRLPGIPRRPELSAAVLNSDCFGRDGLIDVTINKSGLITIDSIEWRAGTSHTVIATIEDLVVTTPGNYTIKVYYSINTFSGTIPGGRVSATYTVETEVMWTNFENVTTISNAENSLMKINGGTAWNAGAWSQNILYEADPGFVQFEWQKTQTDEYFYCGLSSSSLGTDPTSIDFGFSICYVEMMICTGCTPIPMRVLGIVEEGSVVKTYLNKLTDVDINKLKVVKRTDGKFEYIVNGQTVWLSGVISNPGDLRVDAALKYENNVVKNAITNIMCSSILTFNDVQYVELYNDFDGGYYNVTDGTLRFLYNQEYISTNTVINAKIYNEAHQLQTVFTPTLKYGINKYLLNVNSLASGYYYLSVTNEKRENLYLKFKK